MSKEEYPTEHGRFWSWRLWHLDVDVLRLVDDREGGREGGRAGERAGGLEGNAFDCGPIASTGTCLRSVRRRAWGQVCAKRVHGVEALKEVDDIAAGNSGPYRPSIHQSDMDASTFHRCRILSLPSQ
jgi:hypothetical protein